MYRNKQYYEQEGVEAWGKLQALLPKEILQVPNLHWEEVNPQFFRFLYKNLRKHPWLNACALLVVVLTCHAKFDRHTIERYLYGLHARFRVLFPRYRLATCQDWVPDEHISRYFNDAELPDSLETRQHFLQMYAGAARAVAGYLHSLPKELQPLYQLWVLPKMTQERYRAISRAKMTLVETQRRRKAETDALAPHFAQIRAEAHFRWNQIKRLREKHQEAVELVRSGKQSLPLLFSYEETHAQQRLHFRLWDRYSFVEAHAHLFGRTTKQGYRRRVRGFAPEKNHFFLEFLHAESLSDGCIDPDALLWFGDLLRYDLLGRSSTSGTEEEVERKQAYLQSWGYGDEESDELVMPFHSAHSGVLTLSGSETRFLYVAQKRTEGIIFSIEPLYVAATFGLTALSFFTTTGSRHGELLQMSLDRDCLYTMQVEGETRYLMRLVPKGTDQLAEYVIGDETRRNMECVADLLTEHYRLQPGGHLPQVPFNLANGRHHKFPDAKPYLFQYAGRHLPHNAVTASMRFLCHGLVFQTSEGKNVVLKAHALRHVFATHIHQVEQIPLDVIAAILHQKNVEVTAYYAAPTFQQVVETTNTLFDTFATHLGEFSEAFVRAPAELQKQVEEAKAKVGSLNKTPGGQCCCFALCPISFACTGCVYNVPDPDREDEIIEQEQWAFIRLEQVKRRNLGPETVKMQALVQRCQVMRQEMQMIRAYRKDETNDPAIIIEHESASSLAQSTLSGEAGAQRAPSQGRRRSTARRQSTRDN